MKLKNIIYRRVCSLAAACMTLLATTTLLTGNMGYAAQEIPEQMSHTTATMIQDKNVPDNETPEQAVTRYREGAENRDAQSMNNLGSCYHSGDGVARDITGTARPLSRAMTWP